MATATLTRSEIKTAKYPGWTIERTGPGYTMTRPGGIFAISVSHSVGHGWEGTLMTKQRGDWAPARTPFRHSVIGCIAEADRREKTITKYQARPLAPLTKTK